VKATINGRLRELPDELTLARLIELLGSAGKSVAVAQNDRVIRRTEYETQPVRDGDCLEIIEAVAGG